MGVDATDHILADRCVQQFDKATLLEEVRHLAEENKVVIVGLEQLEAIFPGLADDLMGIGNTCTPCLLDSYAGSYLDLEKLQDSFHLVYAGVAVGGFDSTDYRKYLEQAGDRLLSFRQPLQEKFSLSIVSETQKIISPYFRENRKIKISFVVLTGLNNADSLQEMIKSFCRHVEASVDIEVVLVNNGSTDASLEKGISLLGKSYQFKVVNCPENLGISGGYNEGIAVSRGDYVCLLQDDVLFTQKNWHRELAYYLDQHDDIGVIGGFRAGYYFRVDAHNALEIPYLSVGTEVVGENSWHVLKEHVVEADAANCMAVMFRRELGRYDEHFLPNGIEDIAFCFEAKRQGFKVYVTDVGVIHDLPSATRKKPSMDKRRFFKSRAKVEPPCWNLRRLSRAYHFKYFMKQYGTLLRELPDGLIAEEVSLSVIDALVNKRPKNFPGL